MLSGESKANDQDPVQSAHQIKISNKLYCVVADMHQLYQGVIKNLKEWLIQVFGKAEIDARCQCMPPNRNICIFNKGICQEQGREVDR